MYLFYIASSSKGLHFNNVNILGFMNYCKTLFYLTGFSNIEGNSYRLELWDVHSGTELHHRDISSLLLFLYRQHPRTQKNQKHGTLSPDHLPESQFTGKWSFIGFQHVQLLHHNTIQHCLKGVCKQKLRVHC